MTWFEFKKLVSARPVIKEVFCKTQRFCEDSGY